ncbi:hypothetical protein MCOR29_002195 [Pyricularia oryzae]|nr:hypothetical protein MCOR29_002195 [Pyricularia oryzae]KAI6383369.1 hypothetical protein MCOR32_002835 [Pyricularia oryzae]
MSVASSGINLHLQCNVTTASSCRKTGIFPTPYNRQVGVIARAKEDCKTARRHKDVSKLILPTFDDWMHAHGPHYPGGGCQRMDQPEFEGHYEQDSLYHPLYISIRAQAKEVNLVFNVLTNDAKNWPIERIQSSHCGANPRRILQLDWQ